MLKLSHKEISIAYNKLERTRVSFMAPGLFLWEIVMPDKPFKDHDELISILEKRGIVFSNSQSKGYAKKYLQRVGYYNLINGYSFMFFDGKDVYKEGTTFEEIVALYIFDQKIREILLQRILPIETNIKSLVAYYFPQNHKETNYLSYSNFDTSRKGAEKNITALISEIQKQIAGRSTDPSITHYLSKYGYIPLWVLNNILSLGTISKFYSLMNQSERQVIAKTFNLYDDELENMLTYISGVRNFCAHGNRLFCYRSRKPLCDLNIHQYLNIPKSSNNEYLNGKRDLFAVMIIFKMMLSQSDFYGCVNQFDSALNKLYKRLHVIGKEEILSITGFIDTWKEDILK